MLSKHFEKMGLTKNTYSLKKQKEKHTEENKVSEALDMLKSGYYSNNFTQNVDNAGLGELYNIHRHFPLYELIEDLKTTIRDDDEKRDIIQRLHLNENTRERPENSIKTILSPIKMLQRKQNRVMFSVVPRK